MYWFQRPPYHRWAAAVLVVIAAAAIEFRPRPGVDHPFARETIPAGARLTDAMIEWRRVPEGLLPTPATAGVTTRRIERGEPLDAAALDADAEPVPDGWWSIPLPLPVSARPGQSVRIVVTDGSPAGSPATVPGLVLEAAPDVTDLFDAAPGSGLVAVPGEHLANVAAGAVRGAVSVALGAP